MAKPSNPEDRFMEVNNLQLHYLDWGGEGDNLLFLSGLSDTSYSFLGLAPRFVPNFHCYGLTRRGFGQSGIPSDPPVIDQLVDDIRVFLDKLGISKISFIGHSIAGDEMTLFTHLHPERVEKLVYLDAAYEKTRELHESRFQDPAAEFMFAKLPAEAFQTLENYYDAFRYLHPDFNRLWSPLVERMIRDTLRILPDGSVEEVSPGSFRKSIMMSVLELGIRYAGIDAEMLCIYPFKDHHDFLPPDVDPKTRERANNFHRQTTQPLRRKYIEKVQTSNTNVTLMDIKGAEHHCHISHEHEVYASIIDFLLG